MRLPLATGLLLLLPQTVLGWETPVRGAAERRAMMDALRPIAEWSLGAPVEFVIDDLRVAGRAGFAAVTPQRPGGGRIDIATTPMVLRDGEDPAYLDGIAMQALLQKQGQTWVVVHSGIGATDVWWADPRFCGQWAGVIPEVC